MAAVTRSGKYLYFLSGIFAKTDEASYGCALLPGCLRKPMGTTIGLRWRRLGVIKLREGPNENTFRASVKKGYAPLRHGGDSTLIRKSDKWELFYAPC